MGGWALGLGPRCLGHLEADVGVASSSGGGGCCVVSLCSYRSAGCSCFCACFSASLCSFFS